MARGYDRLEYSLMNDIYDEQTYGYSTNSYANESYYNGADYSDYESYNDGYKNGYRAAMEAFGKKKKGFFANIWQKILGILKAIREKLAKLFGKKKSVPQKVWDAVTSEKGRLIAAITAGVGVMTGILIKIITGFDKYKKGDGTDSATFAAYVRSCGEDFKKAVADYNARVKAAGGFDSKKGPMKAVAIIAGVGKTGWNDAMAKLEKIAEFFTKKKSSSTNTPETNTPETNTPDKATSDENVGHEVMKVVMDARDVTNGWQDDDSMDTDDYTQSLRDAGMLESVMR